MTSLLPGPVQIATPIRVAFHREPIHHRSPEMLRVYAEVRQRLGDMLGGMSAALLSGTGTLANDIIAACIRQRFGIVPGLVLANGEFGERLCRQANRAGLRFQAINSPWGDSWNLQAVARNIEKGAAWVWCVHLETSTGMLNDLAGISRLCSSYGASLHADCVSSLGAVPLDGLVLDMASGVSGKSLGSYAGVAIVFASDSVLRELSFDLLPAVFDLNVNIARTEPVTTLPSPQLLALHKALSIFYSTSAQTKSRFAYYAALGTAVRGEMYRGGLHTIVNETAASPVVASFKLQDTALLERCERAGFLIAHESGYLRARRWAQICTMGDLSQHMLEPLFAMLQRRPQMTNP